ncbi:MAG: hypothetical protein JWQ81_6691, partial [Amycolatopsis sp.]|nr:hypothetical protein [Amycolatopsis sp.]
AWLDWLCEFDGGSDRCGVVNASGMP